MDNKTNFHYSYSAPRNQEVQAIRSKYVAKPASALDELKALDSKVQKPVTLFAWFFGAFSAVIMGAGMSLIMTDIGSTIGIADAMVPGLVVGIAGMLLALLNYPIYKRRLKARQNRYADRILALSDQLMKDSGEEHV